MRVHRRVHRPLGDGFVASNLASCRAASGRFGQFARVASGTSRWIGTALGGSTAHGRARCRPRPRWDSQGPASDISSKAPKYAAKTAAGPAAHNPEVQGGTEALHCTNGPGRSPRSVVACSARPTSRGREWGPNGLRRVRMDRSLAWPAESGIGWSVSRRIHGDARRQGTRRDSDHADAVRRVHLIDAQPRTLR